MRDIVRKIGVLLNCCLTVVLGGLVILIVLMELVVVVMVVVIMVVMVVMVFWLRETVPVDSS